MINIKSRSVSDTEKLAQKIASLLNGNEVIALFGDLGAGKTAFTRGLCSGLGFSDGVCSPTFAIINQYNAKFPVFHFDMYRITDIDDLYSTGYYDYLGNGIVIIEWSENIESELDDNAIRIYIDKTNIDCERKITIYGMDEYADIIG